MFCSCSHRVQHHSAFPVLRAGLPHDLPCVPKIRCQTVCKPGSVPPGEPEGDGHSSRARLAAGLVQPTRTAARKHALSALRQTRRPYSVLLPVRFSVPCPSLGTRCALTAPFHPYRRARKRAGGPFSVALSLGSPPPGVTRHRVSVDPGLSSPSTSRCWPRPSDRLAPPAIKSLGGPTSSLHRRNSLIQRGFQG